MKKRTVAFSKDSSNLFFHILTKCNLSCRHCYINPEQHGENTLTIDTIREWLHLFSEKCDQTNVIFLGGEPTLHPDLSLAVREARRLRFKSITIDTNGYLFHDILDRITPDEVDFISFSLDGATQKTNDSIRGAGTYDRVVTGIRRAVERGFSTSMIYTVSSANLHELALMPDLIMGLGIERFFIQVIGIRGTSSTKESSESASDQCNKNSFQRQVSMRAWIETVPDVAQKVAQLGITVTYPKVFLEAGELFECAGVVADNYFIFPNGRVYRCPLCEDYPLHSLEIRGDNGNNVALDSAHITSASKKGSIISISKTDTIVSTPKINESDLFKLDIPEGCVMNKLVQPGNLAYNPDGTACYRVACCMLKEEISPGC